MALQVWLHGKDLINRGLCPNNATWDGPATYADGKLGKCYSCTSSHYISYVYDFASTDKFTIAFWIYIPTSLSTCNRWEQVFCLQEYNINWADYNALKIYDNSNNQLWWLDGNIFYDKWVHLTIAHNTDTITLYINGDHYNTATSTSSPISSGTMYAGRGITDEHGPVKFNDIRLYDHCLSPKEVKEISKGLVLHYPLNQPERIRNLNTATGNIDTWTSMASGGSYQILAKMPYGPYKGKTMTYSIDINNTSGKNICLRYQWYDISKGSSARGGKTATAITPGSNGRFSFSFTLPNEDHEFLQLLIDTNSNTSINTPYSYKCIKLEESSLSNMVWFKPIDFNILKDSTNWNGWTLNSGTALSTDVSFSGHQVLKLSQSGNSSNVYRGASLNLSKNNSAITSTVKVGDVVRVSLYVYTPSSTTLDVGREIRMYQTKPSGTTTDWTGLDGSTDTDKWTYWYHDYIIASDTIDCMFNFNVVKNGTWYAACPKVEVFSKSLGEIEYDCSGYQNNGTITGALSCSADSPRYKTCIETNASQIINTPIGNGIPSSDLTVACWIKRPETIDSNTMRCWLQPPSGNNQRFYFRILPQGNTAIFNIGFGVNGYGNKTVDATWHHLAATTSSDGKTISVYVDGILTNTGTEANAFNLAGDLKLATNFIGKMSDFRFYRTALSAEDIKELYNTSCIINS